MSSINRHKFFLLQVLKDIYADAGLASRLGFKGGTAMMLFYELPRFSVDLDFNLIGDGDTCGVYEKVRQILLKHGSIRDEAVKHNGLLLVLDYGRHERNMKIEVSTRNYPDVYELKDYLGISMNVMELECMFTHKLIALLDRITLTNRDVFDCWFYMNRRVTLSQAILDDRLDCSLSEYLDQCIERVGVIPGNRILDGIGDLLDPDLKKWAKANLATDFVRLAEMYKAVPLIG